VTLHALDDIDDALDATRSLLWPFDLHRWAKFALVVFFVGGTGGVNPLQFGGTTPTGDVPTGASGSELPETLTSIGGTELAVIAAVVGLLFLIGLLFTLVSSIMEFVFVESLRNEAVAVRRYWSEHWRRGLRLFGFRLLLGVLTFGTIGLLIAAALGPALFWDGGFSLVFLVVAVPVGIGIAVVSAIVYGFTNVFVVPVMMIEDRGVLSAWRRFWPTVTDQWEEYAVYAVMGVVLQLAGGVAASIATAIGAVVVAIPLGIVGAVGAGLLAVSQIAGVAVIAVAAVLFVLAVLLIVLFVAVPVQSFLRYYALLVLGDTNETFDLIPERRDAIRA